MARADTKNAHVRGKTKSKRATPGVAASDAQRFMEDPAFAAAFAAVREDAVRTITSLAQDGKPETDAIEREMCRTLRTLDATKRALVRAVSGERLRLANYRPEEPEKDEGKNDG